MQCDRAIIGFGVTQLNTQISAQALWSIGNLASSYSNAGVLVWLGNNIGFVNSRMKTSRNPKRALLLQYLELARSKAVEGHLPLSRQIFEMLILYLYRGLGPGYYLFGRFWRREIALRDKLRHLNERDYARKVAEINNPRYQKLSQNKVAEKALLSLFGIPTPRFFGHLQTSTGRTFRNEPLRDAGDLAVLLEMERPARVCFKLIEGWSGSGFEAAEVDYSVSPPRLCPLPNSDPIGLEVYLNERLKLGGNPVDRIIEEYCQQHTWYQSLNPTSVNTLRIYVISSTEQPIRILGGYLRIGRRGSITDNVSTGGVFCPFDPESGVLEAGRLNTIDSACYSKHPDSGVQLEGCQLPGWKEIRAMIPVALEIFPNTRFAGIDIAMTEEGPAIIELNVEPDRTASCDIDIPTMDMLES